jgi:hypothetical protein
MDNRQTQMSGAAAREVGAESKAMRIYTNYLLSLFRESPVPATAAAPMADAAVTLLAAALTGMTDENAAAPTLAS